ncbi:hypothetical protein ACKTEK_01065 [Tepidamorphus sp. 3E244]|uniref:hypothetical protein n=1 Tax=Tepidamorphus sp. 3E244 TaxID=3385498 RepID=UPI0038FBFF99
MPFGMTARLTTASLIALALVAGAQAQSSTPPDGDGRYLLRKTENGWFRVDQRTGQASLCRDGGGGFTCQLVPDDRDALLEEITRLSEENAMLRAQAKRADLPPVEDEPADSEAKPDEEDELKLPTEEDIDRMMDTFRHMFERFIGMVQEMQRDFSNREPSN